MNSTPLLSVCLITYNHEKFVRQALDGIFMQKTNFLIEVIIADDCSTDSTRKIILEYKAKYPKIVKLIFQEKNVGAAVNWLDLMISPRGKYIAYFDGDDYWTDPLKLQKQADFLEANSDYSMCFHATKTFDEYKKQIYFTDILENRDYNGEEFLRIWTISTASVVFRSKYLDEQVFARLQNPNYIFGDIILFLSLERQGKVFCMNEVMSVYRIHEASSLREFRTKFKLKTIQFIKHHLTMSKDFDGKYRKINYLIISEAYFRLILEEKEKFQKIKYLHKFNYYVFKSSKKTFFSSNHQKTIIYNFFSFLINHV